MNTFNKNLLIIGILLCVIPKFTNAQFVICLNPAACNYGEFDTCDYGNLLCPDPCDESTCPFIFEIPEIFDIPEIVTIPEFDPVWCPWCPVCLSCPPDLDIYTNQGIGAVINPGIGTNINQGIGININSGIGGPKLSNPESNTLSTNSFTLFPNPTNGKATIKLEQNSAVSYMLIVFDLNGKIIQQNTFDSKQTNVDLSNVAKGMYMIQIQNNETKNVLSTQKLLVK